MTGENQTKRGWIQRLPGGQAVIAGASLAMLTLAHSYTYCLDGPARGLPFSIIRPSHQGTTSTTIFIGEIESVPMELNLVGMFVDVVVWSALAAAVWMVAQRIARSSRVREADRLI